METYIYLAGPLFTRAERDFNLALATRLRELGWKIFLPQEECRGTHAEMFATCYEGVKGAKIVVAILDGADADSGTCWEVGFAYGNAIPIVGIRTDFRGTGDSEGFNLMLKFSCKTLLTLDIGFSPETIADQIHSALIPIG